MIKNMKEKRRFALFSRKKAEIVPKPPSQELSPFLAFHGVISGEGPQWLAQEKWKEAVFQQLALAMKTQNVAGEEAEKLVLTHRKWLSFFWKEGMYTKMAHLTLGNIYVAEPRFAAFYDGRVGPGGAQFLRDAMEIYVYRGGVVSAAMTVAKKPTSEDVSWKQLEAPKSE